MRKPIPFVSILIAVACAIVYMTQSMYGEVYTYSLAMYQTALERGEYYRLFTSAFIHYGFLHFSQNMTALVFLGGTLENNIGHFKYLLCYIIGVLGSGICINYVGGNGMHGGASGALWGLMGAYTIYAIRNNYDMSGPLKMLVANVIFTFTVPGISWQGHLGGLIASMLFCWPLCKEKSNDLSYRAWKKAHPNCDDSFYFRNKS